MRKVFNKYNSSQTLDRSIFFQKYFNKYFSTVRGIGKQLYRDKKVGENISLPSELKEKYKSNFENILMTIMNNKPNSKSANKINEKAIETDLEFEIKKTIKPEKKNKSNLTSEESSEDYFEKARIFSENMINRNAEASNNNLKNIIATNLKHDQILLKKNSFLAFADNYSDIEESSLSDEAEGFDAEEGSFKSDFKNEIDQNKI